MSRVVGSIHTGQDGRQTAMSGLVPVMLTVLSRPSCHPSCVRSRNATPGRHVSVNGFSFQVFEGHNSHFEILALLEVCQKIPQEQFSVENGRKRTQTP